MLQQNTITFGKYKGSSLETIFRDRDYCKWLIEQDWFQNNYEYLYNRVKGYNPCIYFIKETETETDNDNDNFIDNYKYFNLTPINEIKLNLNCSDKICYEYYLRMISQIRGSIYQRLENEEENPYDIKAPTRWLKRFEEEYGIPRTDFKEFIDAYELPNIPYIIERVKKEGGIEYKGAQSFKIAKARSEEQETFWENILKEKFGEYIGTQFKFENCIFDMIHIDSNIIFECKLGFKDMNEEQYKKYRKALRKFRVVYIIGKDTIIVLEKGMIYTTNPLMCKKYLENIYSKSNISEFDKIISDFQLVTVDSVTDLINYIDSTTIKTKN